MIVTVDPAQSVETTDTGDPAYCLLLYPLPLWEEVEQDLNKLSSTQPRVRAFKRLLLAYAEEVPLDANGRMLLPGPQRRLARLEKKIVLVGQINKFELWDEAVWYRQQDEWLSSMQRKGDGQDELDNLAY